MSKQNFFDPSYSCHVFRGDDLRVTSGANLGDGLTAMEMLSAGDVYRLGETSGAFKLSVAQPRDGSEVQRHVAKGSELGQPGAPLRIDARLTFMGANGDQVDVLVLELESIGDSPAIICALPLAPIAPRIDYSLIGISQDTDNVELADIASIAFLRGTLVSLSGGRQVPVETLKIGDRILTRDNGAQTLRWIGHKTLRAIGAYAPVVIPRGTFGNSGDLIVSQHQRLFIYQRGAERLTATPEMLVKAQYLVDDETIYVRDGGFADYYTLAFDHHEVIYAECIPCESLEVNAETLKALPKDLAHSVGEVLPDLSHRTHYGTEASAEALQAGRDRLLKGH